MSASITAKCLRLTQLILPSDRGATCALLGGNGAGKTTTLPMNLRPEAAPTFPRQPLPSLPYLLSGCSRRRPTSSIHGVVHPCSRLLLGEGGPKGQVRGAAARSWLQFVATARPGGLSMLLGLLLPTSGHIVVLGEDMLRHRYRVLPRMNFSSPYVDLPHRLTVAENLTV